jgi:hypothetical protein
MKRSMRCGWLGVWALLALALLLPTGRLAAAPVAGLKLADIYLSASGAKTLQLTWNPVSGATFQVQRTQGGTEWTDPLDFVPGTTYLYGVQVVGDPASLSEITVVPQVVTALENQTVDSRTVDNQVNPMTVVYRDFSFGASVYRGGLFVGRSGDPSRVGRSFLKFEITQGIPQGQGVWTVSANAYHTRSFTNGTTTVGCQLVSSNWDSSRLRWTSAPALNPAAAGNGVAVSYDSMSPNPQWVHWTLPVCHELSDGGLVSVGLAAVNEAAGGWAYFAKKEYSAALAPTLLYAYGASLSPISLTLNPASVYGGASLNPIQFPSTSTGTVCINGLAPAGGTVVQLTTSHPLVTLMPSSVTVPAGEGDASFQITTLPVLANTNVTISATLNGVTKTAVLLVKKLP